MQLFWIKWVRRAESFKGMRGTILSFHSKYWNDSMRLKPASAKQYMDEHQSCTSAVHDSGIYHLYCFGANTRVNLAATANRTQNRIKHTLSQTVENSLQPPFWLVNYTIFLPTLFDFSILLLPFSSGRVTKYIEGHTFFLQMQLEDQYTPFRPVAYWSHRDLQKTIFGSMSLFKILLCPRDLKKLLNTAPWFPLRKRIFG